MEHKSESLIKDSADALKASADLHIGEIKNSLQTHLQELVRGLIFSVTLYVIIALSTLHLSYRAIIYLLTLAGVPLPFQNLYLSGVGFCLGLMFLFFKSDKKNSVGSSAVKNREKLKKIAFFNREIESKISKFKYNINNPLSFIENTFHKKFGTGIVDKDFNWYKVTGVLALAGSCFYLVKNYFSEDSVDKINSAAEPKESKRELKKEKSQLMTAINGLLIAAITSYLKEFLAELFTSENKSNAQKKYKEKNRPEEAHLAELQTELSTAH